MEARSAMSCLLCEGPIGRRSVELPCPVACCTEFCTGCIQAKGVTDYRPLMYCCCLTVNLNYRSKVRTDRHKRAGGRILDGNGGPGR